MDLPQGSVHLAAVHEIHDKFSIPGKHQTYSTCGTLPRCRRPMLLGLTKFKAHAQGTSSPDNEHVKRETAQKTLQLLIFIARLE